MDNDALNRILEESFQTVFNNLEQPLNTNNENVSLNSIISNILSDISLNIQPVNASSLHTIIPDVIFPPIRTDTTTTATATNSNTTIPLPDPSITTSTEQRLPDISANRHQGDFLSRMQLPTTFETTNDTSENYMELFETHMTKWYRFTNEYHENLRQYNENTSQMIRVSQNMTRLMQSLRNSNTTRRGLRTETSDATNPYNILIPSYIRDLLYRNNIEIDVQGISGTSENPSNGPLYPTITEILNATERFINNENNLYRLNELTHCPISLEEFSTEEELCQIKQCRHIFKWSSLQTWFSRNSHCPVCRFDVRTYSNSV
jgi:hypothetical protein